MWGRADGDPYEGEDSFEPVQAPPTRLRARLSASLIIVTLLGATARGGWLIFAGPTPSPTPRYDRAVPENAVTTEPTIPMPSVAFAVRCLLSHEASDDPILLAGQSGASHQHSFFGNRNTNAFSTVASLRGQTTSCDDPGDTAAYWLPSPIGARWTSIRAYYGAGVLNPKDISPYPDGIALIGGSATHQVKQAPQVKSMQDESMQDESMHQADLHPSGAVSQIGANPPATWSCGRAVDEPGWTTSIPNCPNGKTLVARIVFGQCIEKANTGQLAWRLASTVPAQLGVCPGSHPVGTAACRQPAHCRP